MASAPPKPPGYGGTAKFLHWTVVALVLAQFVTAYLMPDIKMSTPVSTVISLHFALGVTIVIVMAIRFVHRLMHPVALEDVGNPWERKLAAATHGVFYLILLVVPFLGWASASAHKMPVALWGIPLPALAEPRAKWALTAGDIHTWTMWTLLAIIALHAAAALYHELFRHDGTLRRMMPGRA